MVYYRIHQGVYGTACCMNRDNKYLERDNKYNLIQIKEDPNDYIHKLTGRNSNLDEVPTKGDVSGKRGRLEIVSKNIDEVQGEGFIQEISYEGM